MFDALRRLFEEHEAREAREPLIGYALAFKNHELDVDFFGSPHEILEQIQAGGLTPAALAAHSETEIDSLEVLKDQPELKFSGGPYAEVTMDLLDALDEPGLKGAASILARDPAVLTGAHDGALVPLLAAASSGRLDVVQFLLANGAKVDGATHFDMTPLHWAAARGYREIAVRLLDAGADGKRQSWFFTTPHELATLNKYEETAKLIAERMGTRPDVITPLVILTRMGCDPGR